MSRPSAAKRTSAARTLMGASLSLLGRAGARSIAVSASWAKSTAPAPSNMKRCSSAMGLGRAAVRRRRRGTAREMVGGACWAASETTRSPLACIDASDPSAPALLLLRLPRPLMISAAAT